MMEEPVKRARGASVPFAELWGLTAAELNAFVAIARAAEITTLHKDTLKRNYPDKVVQLSKRRLGMRLGDALMIARGSRAAGRSSSGGRASTGGCGRAPRTSRPIPDARHEEGADGVMKPTFTDLVELIADTCKSTGMPIDEAVERTGEIAIADLSKTDEATACEFAELLKREVRRRMRD
jgi:hypothetical protein